MCYVACDCCVPFRPVPLMYPPGLESSSCQRAPWICPQACRRMTPPPPALHVQYTHPHTTSRQLVPASGGWGHSGSRARQAAGTCSTSACGDGQWQAWCKYVHVRGWRQENTTQHMFVVGFMSRTSEVVSSDFPLLL